MAGKGGQVEVVRERRSHRAGAEGGISSRSQAMRKGERKEEKKNTKLRWKNGEKGVGGLSSNNTGSGG